MSNKEVGKRSHRIHRCILWSFGWILNIILILHVTELDGLFPLRLYGAWLPWVLLVAALAFFSALWQRTPRLAFFLVLPLGYGLFQLVPAYPDRDPPTPCMEGPKVRVISFNVWSKNEKIKDVGGLILQDSPDIVFLQEIAPEQFRSLLDFLDGTSPEQPFYRAYLHKPQLALLSRFPIISQESIGSSRVKIQKALLQSDRGAFLVYNVHFLRKFWKRRIIEIRRFVTEELRPAKLPVILGGDFNATSNDRACRAVREILVNAFDQTGQGFGLTFPASLALGPVRIPWTPMVRIDHIFASPGLLPCLARTADSAAGSDHLPVIAEFMVLEP